MSTSNIYIVDDDDAVRASLHSLLSLSSDLAIRSFPSGDAFLDVASGLDRGVVILDYDMPGSSGLEVQAQIRANDWPFVEILLTGQGTIPLAVRAVRAGACDVLEKPCEYHQLLDAVAAAFTRLEADAAPVARRDEARAKIARLSRREYDVLLGLIEGRSNKVIASDLEISARTVEIYRANMMEKLEVRSLPEALRVAYAAAIIPAG